MKYGKVIYIIITKSKDDCVGQKLLSNRVKEKQRKEKLTSCYRSPYPTRIRDQTGNHQSLQPNHHQYPNYWSLLREGYG